MITVGIDAGSRYIKAVLIDINKEVIARKAALSGYETVEITDKLLSELCVEARIKRDDIKCITATGVGRTALDVADYRITEITAASAVFRRAHDKSHYANSLSDAILESSASLALVHAGLWMRYCFAIPYRNCLCLCRCATHITKKYALSLLAASSIIPQSHW